jgi:hypothetical protein
VRRAHTVRSYLAHVTTDDRNPNTTTGSADAGHDPIPHYEIRVRGRLASNWSAWFDGLTIDTDPMDGTSAIRGPVIDQAALHGLLQKLRDVGLTLVSLTELPNDTSTEPSAHPHQKDN